MSRRVVALLALVVLGLQLGPRLDLALLSLALWLATLALGARASLRPLIRPGFWVLTVVLALGAGLLLGPTDAETQGITLSTEGLAAGAHMATRGAFLFTLSTWASRAVAPADLDRWSRRVGLGGLGGAVAAAVGLLPGLVSRLERRRRERGPTLAGLVDAAVALVEETARTAEEIATHTMTGEAPVE